MGCSWFESKRKNSSVRSARLRMIITLALCVCMVMCSLALAATDTQPTQKVKIANNYYAKAEFKATRTSFFTISTGGANGKADYWDANGNYQNTAYYDCGVPYALVSFSFRGGVVESKWSNIGEYSWGMIPTYNTLNLSQVLVTGGVYDFPARKYVSKTVRAKK